MKELDLIVGSGGVVSHAPRRLQSFIMMVDSFKPEGVTQIAVDSIFMMPQLGVLSSIHQEAALEVFDRDCLIRLGTTINPLLRKVPKDKKLFDYHFSYQGTEYAGTIKCNQVELISIPYTELNISLTPTSNVDLGNGFGQKINCTAWGGEIGVFFDGRLKDSSNKFIIDSKDMVLDWYNKLGVYSL